jgi:hypothetical protein
MGLIVRPYVYLAGSVVIADQNNANDNLLYSTVNGNITDDNLGVVAESAITFAGTGHQHTGGTGGAKFNIAQDTSPDDYLIQLTATATGSALKAIAVAAGKSAIHGTGGNATGFGGYFNNTAAASVALSAENIGLGSGAEIRNNVGASLHALVVKNLSTDATVRAGIHIPTVSTATHYGLWIQNIAGIPIRIDLTGAGASNAIQIVGDRTFPMILCQPSGTGAGVRVDGAAAGGTGIGIPHAGIASQVGLDVDMTGVTGNQKGITVDMSSASNSSSGIVVTCAAGIGLDVSTGGTTSCVRAVSTGTGAGLSITSTNASGVGLSVTSLRTAAGSANTLSNTGAGRTLDVIASTTNVQGLQVTSTITDTGGLASEQWAAIITTGLADSTRNGLRVLGRVHVAGTFTAFAGKGFLNPYPGNPEKALHYICLEGPENAIFWRTRGVAPIPEGYSKYYQLDPHAFLGHRVHIPVPEYVTLAIPEGSQLDVSVTPAEGLPSGCIGAYHDPDTREIVVSCPIAGLPFSILCLGTRRYFENHEPVIAQDWSESRKTVGSAAYRAYGPN